jgi:hypothetical protein
MLYKKMDKGVVFAGCVAKRKCKSNRVNYLYFTIFARLTESPEPEWKRG